MKLFELKENTNLNIPNKNIIFRKCDGAYGIIEELGKNNKVIHTYYFTCFSKIKEIISLFNK